MSHQMFLHLLRVINTSWSFVSVRSPSTGSLSGCPLHRPHFWSFVFRTPWIPAIIYNTSPFKVECTFYFSTFTTKHSIKTIVTTTEFIISTTGTPKLIFISCIIWNYPNLYYIMSFDILHRLVHCVGSLRSVAS